MGVECPYCGVNATLVTGATVYPHRPDLSRKFFFMCEPCQAWVGCHPDTKVPMGRLADAELRKLKGLAHVAFDKLWDYAGAKGSRSQRRGKAYRALAHRMGLPREQCHIGMFNVDQCKQVINLCSKGRIKDG